MQRLTVAIWGFGILAVSCAAKGASLHTDDFQNGTTDGWSGAAAPTMQSMGGPNGDGDAFLMISASGENGPGSRLSTYNSDANWTGDFDSLGAGRITVDLKNFANSPLQMRIVLFGPSLLSNRWTSTTAVSVPNDESWHHYEFSLAETDLTRVAGSSEYDELMGGVVRVMLRHDEGPPSPDGTPISATLGIDNVRLATLPAVISGDFNGDGSVNAADYTVWRDHLGETDESSLNGGGDGMNGVDAGDYSWWAGHFMGDTSSKISPVTSAVPEPELALTLFVATIGGMAWTRTKICETGQRKPRR